jgi:SAM-dependent methyltransferase
MILTSIIKSQVRRSFPRGYSGLHRLRARYSRIERLTRKVGAALDWMVASGPFQGMHYVQESHGSRLLPKLIGSYESCLHTIIAELAAMQPAVVVDVGCAEGYYAVGLARLLPNAVVFAFDTDPAAQDACRRLAVLNGVDRRVMVGGYCGHAALSALRLDGAALICDCEGYELELLDPAVIPGLARAFILVELHDWLIPELSQTLYSRFAGTHNIDVIDEESPHPHCPTVLEGLDAADRLLALDEDRVFNGRRVPMQWAFLRPHANL